VQHHLPQPPDFGVDVEGHGYTPASSVSAGSGNSAGAAGVLVVRIAHLSRRPANGDDREHERRPISGGGPNVPV
jgi:hypothetical protein